MAKSPDYSVVFQRYHETEAKFEYFIVGSTLAILAFSIQYMQPSNLFILRWLIVCSWTSFLLSFLVGVWRLETIVVIRKRDVAKAERADEEPPEDWKKQGKRLIGIAFWAYYFQKALLLIGLTAYALFHIMNFLNRN